MVHAYHPSGRPATNVPIPLDGIHERDTGGERNVCRNIRVLFNFDPPATADEIQASALQYVRKISGFANPSAANKPAFDRAVREVARASSALLETLVTNAPPRNREAEAARAHARAVLRYGSPPVRK